MAQGPPACDRCGHQAKVDEKPPSVGPCRFSNPVASWEGDLCKSCEQLVLDLLADIFQSSPGGTLRGDDAFPYLYRPAT